MEPNEMSVVSTKNEENNAKIAEDYTDLGQEGTEEGITINIPDGKIGELRCAFKAGCDCMGVVYSRPNSNDVNVVGSCDQGTQTGDKAKHRFPSGAWNLWVYNRTRLRFERMTKKSVTSDDGASSFVLGATHRVSPTQKTCIVCVVDMVPEK